MTEENGEGDYSDLVDKEEEMFEKYWSSSEEESDVECPVWDKDCKLIPRVPAITEIIGYHLLPTCSNDPDLPPAKKRQKRSFEINVGFLKNDFVNKFKESFSNNSACPLDNLRLILDPFKVCVFRNFLQNPSMLNKIRQEFYTMNFNARNMDLYDFFQSKDLNFLQTEVMQQVYNFLKNDAMKWVSQLTGFNLTHVSATCSIYTNTDYLLVHDDQREDRKVAFIFYLTNKDVTWGKEKGGALQLFSKDKFGQPNEVVKEIFPENNQLIIFPVTNDSYHQVAEVTSMSDCRLSINGWFHTKQPPVFHTPSFQTLEDGIYGTNLIQAKNIDIDLTVWLNPNYLIPQNQKAIQQHIEDNSEISLRKFLQDRSFQCVYEELQSDLIDWKKVGPPNRFKYEVADCDSLPHTVDKLIKLFQSTDMFELLHKYTDLELTTEKAGMKFELQRWTPGCYSLLTDYDWEAKSELDIMLHFGCHSSAEVVGARTQYVTLEDEIQNALITMDPEENNLNIVYRDSARFTKYYSVQSRCKCFYTLICSYSE